MKPNTFLRAGGAIGGAALLTGFLTAMGAGTAGATQTPTASVADDTLTVTGTARADNIALLPAGTQLGVDFDGNGTADQLFDRATFSKVALNGRSGDDTLRVANGLQDEAITVHGDSGDDTILGGNGAETLAGDSGDDFVDGNQGNDNAVLGSGKDTFQWDPGDGSDTVDGDSGRDTLLFNGANINEIMRLSANGERSVFTRNIGNIRMDMDHVERLELHALGGVDDVTVDDMSGTDMRRADIDLAATGGQPDTAVDTVTVNGTPGDDDIRVDADNGGVEASGLHATTAITGADTFDQLKVDTFTGDSNVRVSAAAKALMQIAVDIGT